MWVSLLSWGYASGKVHWDSHRAVLSHSFTNQHFQFWEKMKMIFYSHIPNVAFFSFQTRTYIKSFLWIFFSWIFIAELQRCFSLPICMYLFSIFNAFIMIFSCWSSKKKKKKRYTTLASFSCCHEYHHQWRYIFWLTLKGKINNEQSCKMYY